MTDERLADGLLDAVARVPRGGGVVFRHHGLPTDERRALAQAIARLCRRRGLTLVIADPPAGMRAVAVHLPTRVRRRPRNRPALVTAAAHDMQEAARAGRLGAQLLFVSPVFATASHPGARTLGPLRFGLLVQRLRLPVIALGGLDTGRYRRLKPLGADGFAAIGFFAREARAVADQKASLPPT